MRELNIVLRGDYIELCKLLKLAGLSGSGGSSKQLIAESGVRVDGVTDTRIRAKIRAGQTVECGDARITVSTSVADQ